ncbi:MAG TPA: hypothetical protein VF076_07225 [Acidimicrobiales bacterium]
MADAGVISVIAILSLAGGLVVSLVVDLVDAVWAGRRQFPRVRR